MSGFFVFVLARGRHRHSKCEVFPKCIFWWRDGTYVIQFLLSGLNLCKLSIKSVIPLCVGRGLQ